MFEHHASARAEPSLAGMDDASVVDVITDASRRQRAMCARELAAIGELYARRAPKDDVDRENWAIDGHDTVVAEVAAALGRQHLLPAIRLPDRRISAEDHRTSTGPESRTDDAGPPANPRRRACRADSS